MGKTFVLLKSYLKDGHQRLILDDKYAGHNTYSDWGKIKHGFPQGSILDHCCSFFTLMTYQKTQMKIPK
jgi:hypothetical protein